MESLLTAAGGVLVPVVAVVPFLWLANHVERARHEVVARQIRLTDAIHARLGFVAAPTVVKRPGRPWQVLVALPFANPDLVGQVLSIVHDTLASIDRRAVERMRIVVTPQEPSRALPRPPARNVESAGWRGRGLPEPSREILRREAVASRPEHTLPQDARASGA
jgi:hypothetical protein